MLVWRIFLSLRASTQAVSIVRDFSIYFYVEKGPHSLYPVRHSHCLMNSLQLRPAGPLGRRLGAATVLTGKIDSMEC